MSRYPAMSQAPAAYDRSLLVGAPTPTRADRQAGYDINALEQGTYATQHPYGNPIVPAATTAPPARPADSFEENYYSRDLTPSPIPSKQPWWKTKRGRLILCLALIVFIGIISGIAAGVATARNSRNTTTLGENQNSASTPALVSVSPNTSSITPPASTTRPTITRTTPQVEGPLVTSTRGSGTTLNFGSGPTNTLPPGVSLPTATAPGSGDVDDNEEIPFICYIVPSSSDCAPYFEGPDFPR